MSDADSTTYLKAFSKDLERIAVWPPGKNLSLGDYGKFQAGSWLKLGSLWDLIPQLKPYNGSESSSPGTMIFGSAHLEKVAGHAAYSDNSTLDASVSIKFNKDYSLYLSASDYVTSSLKSVQAIAEILVKNDKWDTSWNFIHELDTAGNFQVVIGKKNGKEAKLEARSGELMKSFINGEAGLGGEIQISGSGVTSFIGKTGPISVGLVRVRKAWLTDRAVVDRDLMQYSTGSRSESAFEVISHEEALRDCDIS